MNKTKIPWCDYTLNPVKGLCPMACSYCYARRMYERFKWNPEIRYEPEVMCELTKMPDGSKVFWGSTIELFGEWTPRYAMAQIFEAVRIQDNLTHIFLTKQPQNLIKFSPFPDNCWVGVSTPDTVAFSIAVKYLQVITAKVKYLSVEPMLSRIITNHWELDRRGINWVILGSQTQPTKHPPREWVDEIITATDKANIPIFVKEPMASHYGIFRQEFPDEVFR